MWSCNQHFQYPNGYRVFGNFMGLHSALSLSYNPPTHLVQILVKHPAEIHVAANTVRRVHNLWHGWHPYTVPYTFCCFFFFFLNINQQPLRSCISVYSFQITVSIIELFFSVLFSDIFFFIPFAFFPLAFQMDMVVYPRLLRVGINTR